MNLKCDECKLVKLKYGGADKNRDVCSSNDNIDLRGKMRENNATM